MHALDSAIQKRVNVWLEGPFDADVKSEIKRLLKDDPKSLSDAFFKDLDFGTGGMRGLMGVGTNRLNVYTIRAATQGLANYLLMQGAEASVFIGYDVRRNSLEFAQETARVLAGNGIRVLLADRICPTPLVSFGCRHFGCSGAVMITASHNPPQYNGYKVYWSDGGQVVEPHDAGIIEMVRKVTSPEQIKMAPLESELIQQVGDELDAAYLKELQAIRLSEGGPLKIIYSNLHGTGIRIMPEALQSCGFTALSFVEKQKPLDGQFTYAPSPNPEEEKALALGMEQLVREKGDLFIATDPDADRVGIAVLDKGKAVRLTGNQIACVCLDYICTTLQGKGELPLNAAFVKSIVTTELFRAIAESFGSACIDVLTGFKYIAEQILIWENSFDGLQFVFGAEESYGFLFGTFVRDKDAISTSCLIAEAALAAKAHNLTLIDRLHQIYRKYGVYQEGVKSVAFTDSLAGLEQMRAMMRQLREAPPREIANQKVKIIEDYLKREKINLETGAAEPISLPKSDALRFWLADGSKLVIRPSGTEPKMKIYAEAKVAGKDIDATIEICRAKVDTLLMSLTPFLGT